MKQGVDTFYVGAYWASRMESADECARRLEDFLSSLVQVDESFSHWFRLVPPPGIRISDPDSLRKSRGKWTRREVAVDRVELSKVIAQGRYLAESDGSVIHRLGYDISLVSRDGAHELGGLTVHCGAYDGQTPNNSILTLPHTGSDSSRYLHQKTLVKVMESTVRAWHPSWAVATSDEYRNALGESNPGCFVGWITYLNTTIARLPSLPPPSHSLGLLNGSLVVLARERPDPKSVSHVEQGQALSAVLRKAGLLHPII